MSQAPPAVQFENVAPLAGLDFVHINGATGFEEFHGGVPSGLKVTYYVSQNSINATYGKNVGAQYIPICAGTFKSPAFW